VVKRLKDKLSLWEEVVQVDLTTLAVVVELGTFL
jgi:hypothetical protein